VIAHLRQIQRFVEDVDTWNETYDDVRIPVAELE
jgi:hypothetical protein